MANYIHDIARRVLEYRNHVEAVLTAPSVNHATVHEHLRHRLHTPQIPTETLTRFDQVEMLLDECKDITLDGNFLLYAKTIFPTKPIKPRYGSTLKTTTEECCALAEDLRDLGYLFDEPRKWPEFKLLDAARGLVADQTLELALGKFFKSHDTEMIQEYARARGWIYKPTYNELVVILTPSGKPKSDKRFSYLVSDIVRICETYSLYRFRRMTKTKLRYDLDFLRFERPTKTDQGTVRLNIPTWVADIGLKNNFPRKALAVVIRQEHRKRFTTLPDRARTAVVPTDVLFTACINVLEQQNNPVFRINMNSLYGLINDECEQICGYKISASEDQKYIGRTLRNRLSTISPSLWTEFQTELKRIKDSAKRSS